MSTIAQAIGKHLKEQRRAERKLLKVERKLARRQIAEETPPVHDTPDDRSEAPQ